MIFIWLFSILVSLQTEWELRKDKDGIQVFVKDTDDIPVKAFKGIATLDGRPEKFLTVIKDLANYPKWLDKCMSAQVVEVLDDNNYYIHTKMDMPFPVSNRDVVQKVTINQNYPGGILISIASASDYIDEEDGFVRVPYSTGYWLLSPKGSDRTLVELVSESDPGGSLPKWLVNSMIVATPFNMMKDIENYALEN